MSTIITLGAHRAGHDWPLRSFPQDAAPAGREWVRGWILRDDSGTHEALIAEPMDKGAPWLTTGRIPRPNTEFDCAGRSWTRIPEPDKVPDTVEYIGIYLLRAELFA